MTRSFERTIAIGLICIAGGASAHTTPSAAQQTSPQPPPFTVPNPPTPAASDAPGQQSVPAERRPNVSPDAPLPQPDKTSIDLRSIRPLAAQPSEQPAASGFIKAVGNSSVRPQHLGVSAFDTNVFNFIAPYHVARVSGFNESSQARLDSFVRDGKLYLSLHDAIALAIANNLDVEIERYNVLSADYDLLRAQGGGNLRGIDFGIQQTAPGVGTATSPLTITATSGIGSSTNATVTDLSQVTQTGSSMQQSLAENGTSNFSSGPAVPIFDPTLFAEAGYFRRSDTTSLESASSTDSSSGFSTSTPPADFISMGVDLQKGFSTGGQLEIYVDNASQVLYANSSQLDPFHVPSSSATFSQPLLRGAGTGINLRFIHIAKINKKVSNLLFEQQLLETVYGISRLYYDLVSLGENFGVKEESLAAAQKLFDDDQNQVNEGTLAPIELTRARALLSSSRLDVIQAEGEYRQQEVILKEQMQRKLGDTSASFSTIVPIDRIVVPDQLQAVNVSSAIEDALSNRPDLAQATLQVEADEDYLKGSRNAVKPLVNAYANVQTRGSTLVPPEVLGSAGTGAATLPAELTQGGLKLSTIYQAGVQVTLPLRNRIAQADAARDAIQLKQAQGRTEKLANDIRQQIENSATALESAQQTYAAAVESVNYQQQLLQAEIDKFSVGESTNYMIIQDQAYLAQARSTEVAARSNWMKARLSLDRALGDLLQKSGITFDEALRNAAH
ncbi:TolC family protein [Acidicapsa ligni]|uniref:TolC family protein n=1 Tax=Acidicapsa ligni TaxID=542300 RepID=UPI0021DF8041|nr:TolC family protein [Acidicapsa ligni]